MTTTTCIPCPCVNDDNSANLVFNPYLGNLQEILLSIQCKNPNARYSTESNTNLSPSFSTIKLNGSLVPPQTSATIPDPNFQIIGLGYSVIKNGVSSMGFYDNSSLNNIISSNLASNVNVGTTTVVVNYLQIKCEKQCNPLLCQSIQAPYGSNVRLVLIIGYFLEPCDTPLVTSTTSPLVYGNQINYKIATYVADIKCLQQSNPTLYFKLNSVNVLPNYSSVSYNSNSDVIANPLSVGPIYSNSINYVTTPSILETILLQQNKLQQISCLL